MIIVFNKDELIVDGFEVRMVELQKEFDITNGGYYNAITEIELYKNNEQVDVEDCRIVSDELIDKIEVIINDMKLDSLVKVTHEEAISIIESRTPLGLFK